MDPEQFMNNICERVRLSIEPNKQNKIHKRLTKLFASWQTNNLMPGDKDPAPTQTDRQKTFEFHKSEVKKAERNREQGGSHRFGRFKKTLNEVNKQISHCLTL